MKSTSPFDEGTGAGAEGRSWRKSTELTLKFAAGAVVLLLFLAQDGPRAQAMYFQEYGCVRTELVRRLRTSATTPYLGERSVLLPKAAPGNASRRSVSNGPDAEDLAGGGPGVGWLRIGPYPQGRPGGPRQGRCLRPPGVLRLSLRGTDHLRTPGGWTRASPGRHPAVRDGALDCGPGAGTCARRLAGARARTRADPEPACRHGS